MQHINNNYTFPDNFSDYHNYLIMKQTVPEVLTSPLPWER
jgi:hypothetical protein